jgi:hypothetical protein
MLTDAEIALLQKTVSSLSDLELAQLAHVLAMRSHVLANELMYRLVGKK